MATISTRSLNPVVWVSSQDLNVCFERPSTTASSLDAPVLLFVGVKSMMTVTYLVAGSGTSPGVLIDADGGDTLKPVSVVDQLGAGGQDRVGGGVPRNTKQSRGPGDRHLVDHDRLDGQHHRNCATASPFDGAAAVML